MATKMISKSINDPNGKVIICALKNNDVYNIQCWDLISGAITVDVIQECKCIYEKCYRVDYWESYWNHSVCGNTTSMKQEKVS